MKAEVEAMPKRSVMQMKIEERNMVDIYLMRGPGQSLLSMVEDRSLPYVILNSEHVVVLIRAFPFSCHFSFFVLRCLVQDGRSQISLYDSLPWKLTNSKNE